MQKCVVGYITLLKHKMNKDSISRAQRHASISCSEEREKETNGVKMKRNGYGRARMSGRCLAT
jgi:hypothetical protein